MPLPRFAGIAGAIAGFLTVLLGAFGAHALAPRVDAHAMEIWHTATLYQGLHALALLTLAHAASAHTQGLRRVSAWGFIAGLIFFCGSLYGLALGAPHWIGMLTPLGGLAWLIAWGALAVAYWRS
jgi:uncharacterized membrane protein YgdD (TMEM256/DUF423 family)